MSLLCVLSGAARNSKLDRSLFEALRFKPSRPLPPLALLYYPLGQLQVLSLLNLLGRLCLLDPLQFWIQALNAAMSLVSISSSDERSSVYFGHQSRSEEGCESSGRWNLRDGASLTDLQ